MCFDGWKNDGMWRIPNGRSFQQSANTQKPFNGFETKVAGTEWLSGKLLNLLDPNPRTLMKHILKLRTFWILLVLFLTFFVSRIVLFTEGMTNFIEEIWE